MMSLLNLSQRLLDKKDSFQNVCIKNIYMYSHKILVKSMKNRIAKIVKTKIIKYFNFAFKCIINIELEAIF